MPLKKCPKCSYQTEKLFNFNRHVGKCAGVETEQAEATGSGHFSCDKCLLSVSTKDALKRHQRTESCATRAMELAEGLFPPLRKYSKLFLTCHTYASQKRARYSKNLLISNFLSCYNCAGEIGTYPPL